MNAFFAELFSPDVALILVFAYGLGSIPVGLILVKWLHKKDVRQQGSGNIGATNVARAADKKTAALTLILDAAKGFVPVAIASSMQYSLEIQMTVGIAAFLGHCYPIWLKFLGGKGVATGFGVIMAASYSLAIVAAAAFVLGALISRRVSVGSLIAAPTVLGASMYIWESGVAKVLLAAMVLILVLRHRDNIRRLLWGEEPG